MILNETFLQKKKWYCICLAIIVTVGHSFPHKRQQRKPFVTQPLLSWQKFWRAPFFCTTSSDLYNQGTPCYIQKIGSPNSFLITLARRAFHSESFSTRTETLWNSLLLGCFPKHHNLNLSSLGLIIIYSPYPRNLYFLFHPLTFITHTPITNPLPWLLVFILEEH